MALWALIQYYKAILGSGTTWATKMNFGMNHVPGAGLIALHLLTRSPARYNYATTPPYYSNTTGNRIRVGNVLQMQTL